MAMKLDPLYVMCRSIRHSWDTFNPRNAAELDREWGTRLSLRCTRCKTERHDYIDSLGQLADRKYKHPDDYHLSKDETPDLAQFRLMMLKSMNGRR